MIVLGRLIFDSTETDEGTKNVMKVQPADPLGSW